MQKCWRQRYVINPKPPLITLGEHWNSGSRVLLQNPEISNAIY
jgi:hypothetical protein